MPQTRSLLYILLALVTSFGLSVPASAQTLPAPTHSFSFWPNYTLPGRAAQYAGYKEDSPKSIFITNQAPPPQYLIEGLEATDVRHNILQRAYPIRQQTFPSGDFSFECLISNHVNKPIALSVQLYDKRNNAPLSLLTYYAKRNKRPCEIQFGLSNNDTIWLDKSLFFRGKRATRTYWYHIVASRKGEEIELFVNGRSISKGSPSCTFPEAKHIGLNVIGHLQNEPYMELGNVLKSLHIYDKALVSKQVKALFTEAERSIQLGNKYPKEFHFNTAPYLHNVTQTGISITWESNLSASAQVEYGTTNSLGTQKYISAPSSKASAAEGGYIQSITLEGLEPNTKYFYKVSLDAGDKKRITSRILSFQTAPTSEDNFLFGVLGDTEARPHVNNKIAKSLWGERPNFVLHLGDLTDEGLQNAKWQWNFEYFAGMSQLFSRVPVFPTVGNGESDLYWFNKYHVLPEEAYYSFAYGNAEFFVLNSNQKEELAPNGKQWTWLQTQLQQSTAQWKFVTLHHAPYSVDEDQFADSYRKTGPLGDSDIRKIIPLCEQYEVDMILFGGNHTYSRLGPIRDGKLDNKKGIWYIQSGGAGGNLEDFAPERAWFSKKTYVGYHYLTIQIYQNQLALRMYDLAGQLKDTFDKIK